MGMGPKAGNGILKYGIMQYIQIDLSLETIWNDASTEKVTLRSLFAFNNCYIEPTVRWSQLAYFTADFQQAESMEKLGIKSQVAVMKFLA